MGTKTEMMSGAQIIIETLIEQGVTDVFGYPGGQVLNIYDELYKASDRINHVLAAHEQGASHAADGYSRVTGKVGVVIATSGPGATNLVTGIATAMLDSIPMVAITGNVPTSLIGKDSFQEINIMGITLPITKHNYFVTDVNELADTIREAFQIAKSGRPGPVLIDVPKDVQIAKCEYERKGVVDFAPLKIADDSDVEKAVELINKCEKPYIYIGGGAAGLGMTKEIMAFADKIDAYIGCTFMGLSAMPNSYERFLGMEGMHGHYASSMANKEADLIIGIGVRFSDRATGNTAKYATGAKLIQLDVDLSEINKNIQVDVGLVGDIKSSFARISERCEKAEHKQWEQEVTALKTEEKRIIDEAEEASNGAMTPKKIFDVINKVKDKSTIIATDVGQHQMWAAQYYHYTKPRTFLSSGGLGTMGYGLGACIGAQIGQPDKVCINIAGDGCFRMNMNELATASRYNIPIIQVVINNQVLGMVRQWQTLFYGKRYSQTVLKDKVDFCKVAEGLGCTAIRVTKKEEVAPAIEKAIALKAPVMIECMIPEDDKVFPMVPAGAPISEVFDGDDLKRQS